MSDMSLDSDYLATERTFLAWVRTALALLGFGIVVSRFFVSSFGGIKVSVLVGTFSLVTSIIFLLFATYRYFHTIDAIEGDDFTADRVGPALVCAFTLTLLLASFAVVVKLQSTVKNEAAASGSGSGGQPRRNTRASSEPLKEPLIRAFDTDSAEEMAQANNPLLDKLEEVLLLLRERERGRPGSLSVGRGGGLQRRRNSSTMRRHERDHQADALDAMIATTAGGVDV